jgi:hypothetical protein
VAVKPGSAGRHIIAWTNGRSEVEAEDTHREACPLDSGQSLLMNKGQKLFVHFTKSSLVLFGCKLVGTVGVSCVT